MQLTDSVAVRLHNGDPFPEIAVARTGGGWIALPGDLAGSFSVVLIYRGAWCPYCNAQLSAFQRAQDAFAGLSIKIVAFSVDDEPTTAALVEKLRLTFPVGYGANADAIAAVTGAYHNHDPRYLHSTGFVLDPNGRIVAAVYSSGAIGRLVPDDVIGLVRYVVAHA